MSRIERRLAGKSNEHLVHAVRELQAVHREGGGAVWREVARRLQGSRQHWSEVNLSRVARHAKAGETVVVPGVLLGTGTLPFAVTVAAYRTSETARKKVEAAGGRVVDLASLARELPKGTGVRLLG